MTVTETVLHALHLDNFARRFRKKAASGSVVPAKVFVTAPPPPAGPSIEERSTVIATQLFTPLEGAVLASLDALLDPAYLKGVGLSDAQAAPVLAAAETARVTATRSELEALLGAARQEAEAAREREAAALAELAAVREAAATELAATQALLAASEARGAQQARAAEQAQLEQVAAMGKVADAEGRLEITEQRLLQAAGTPA